MNSRLAIQFGVRRFLEELLFVPVLTLISKATSAERTFLRPEKRLIPSGQFVQDLGVRFVHGQHGVAGIAILGDFPSCF